PPHGIGRQPICGSEQTFTALIFSQYTIIACNPDRAIRLDQDIANSLMPVVVVNPERLNHAIVKNINQTIIKADKKLSIRSFCNQVDAVNGETVFLIII